MGSTQTSRVRSESTLPAGSTPTLVTRGLLRGTEVGTAVGAVVRVAASVVRRRELATTLAIHGLVRTTSLEVGRGQVSTSRCELSVGGRTGRVTAVAAGKALPVLVGMVGFEPTTFRANGGVLHGALGQSGEPDFVELHSKPGEQCLAEPSMRSIVPALEPASYGQWLFLSMYASGRSVQRHFQAKKL
jgi:hypothetical protein